jgi:hypothetical protein
MTARAPARHDEAIFGWARLLVVDARVRSADQARCVLSRYRKVNDIRHCSLSGADHNGDRIACRKGFFQSFIQSSQARRGCLQGLVDQVHRDSSRLTGRKRSRYRKREQMASKIAQRLPLSSLDHVVRADRLPVVCTSGPIVIARSAM